MSSATIAPSFRAPSTNRGRWQLEGAVLAHLLDRHPRRLTLRELTDELGRPTAGDDVARAVRNLAAARFLRLDSGVVSPTAAVLDFDNPDPASGR